MRGRSRSSAAGVVLGDHQVAVAELHHPVPLRHAARGRGAVGADVVGHARAARRRSASRAAGRARRGRRRSPTARGPRRNLAVRPRVLERLAPVEGDRAVGAERLAAAARRRARAAMADEPVLAPAVDDMPAASIASRRCSGSGPCVRISLGATEPTPGSSSRRRAAATNPGVEEAVGLQEEHGVAVHAAAAPRSSRGRRSSAPRGARSGRRARPPPRAVESSEALSSTTTSTSSCARAGGSAWRRSSPSLVEITGRRPYAR